MSLALTLLLLAAGLVYLRGWALIHLISTRTVPAWRAGSFFAGLFCTWVAVASPVAHSDGRMLTAHMVQHLLLMTFAPPLLWLGAPMLPLLRSLPTINRLSRSA